jgi:hypothetical protein
MLYIIGNLKMGEKVVINDVELILSDPDEISQMQWIGGEVYLGQLLAAWMIVDPQKDIPMNPQILGKPGVGKTTLAYSAAKSLGLPVYIFQCTVDTRPEDLLISPVIGENNTIKYHTSALVSAMIKGGVCILDEANRMSEKSWASLAALLDTRRYIESIIAGIKIQAHPNFRVCVTMNDDSSTFEVPEYIHSRLQPQIFIEFPEYEEEFQILQFNIPYAKQELVQYTVNFLQRAHKHNKTYTVRDGINICRYYLKLEHQKKKQDPATVNGLDPEEFSKSVRHVLDREAVDFLHQSSSDKPPKGSEMSQFKDFFDKLNRSFMDEQKKKRSSKDDYDVISDDDVYDEIGDDGEEDIDENEEFIDDVGDDDFYDIDADQEKRQNDDTYLDRMRAKQDDVIHIEPRNQKGKGDPFFEEEEPSDPNDVIKEFLDRKKREHSQDENGGNPANVKKSGSSKEKSSRKATSGKKK